MFRHHLEFPPVRRWLYPRYAATGRRAEAHALTREEVLKIPSEAGLTATKDVSPDWETERAEVVRRFWKQEAHTFP